MSRDNTVPVLKATGTHYEVGKQIVSTKLQKLLDAFPSYCQQNRLKAKLHKGSQAKDLLQKYFKAAQSEYSTTSQSQELFDGYLRVANHDYPQYVEEIQGIADGSGVNFKTIFMTNLYELNMIWSRTDTVLRCTDVIINTETTEVIAHNEDVPFDEFGCAYIVDVCCINDRPRGRLFVPEERFVSYCYPGGLPGAAFSYNSNGLVTTVNYITGKYMKKHRLPIAILLRATLSAESSEHLNQIIRNPGSGVGTATNLNVAFLSNKDKFYKYEIYNRESNDPDDDSVETGLEIIEIQKKRRGSKITETKNVKHGFAFNCNAFRAIPDECIPHTSSKLRTEFLESLEEPSTKDDLYDTLAHPKIWRPLEGMEGEDESGTIASVIFDLDNEEIEVYTSNRPSSVVTPDIKLKLTGFS